MQERRVTVDVHSHELARPFLVIATQNPIEYEGTYPLPEAQVDRFMVRLSLGYPERRAEADMLSDHQGGDQVLSLGPVATAAEVLAAQDAAIRIRAAEPLRDYIVRLLWRTREDPRVDLGASPAGRPDAAAGGQGPRHDARPRSRPSRRRPGPGQPGTGPPSGARPGDAAKRRARGHRRRGLVDPGPMKGAADW